MSLNLRILSHVPLGTSISLQARLCLCYMQEFLAWHPGSETKKFWHVWWKDPITVFIRLFSQPPPAVMLVEKNCNLMLIQISSRPVSLRPGESDQVSGFLCT